MDSATRVFVRVRAGERCEYCLLRREQIDLPLHVEHIIAKQHGGSDDPENLALCCGRCSLSKGPNLSGIDPERAELVPLFNPRRNEWAEHFAFQGYQIIGLTPVGRASVYVFAMNEPRRLELRAALLARGELS
jgi:5-methylcytosine-specific restriction endonuclease McrA